MSAETIQIDVKIDDQFFEDIIVTALEGGSNYWIGHVIIKHPDENKPKDTPNSIWAADALNKGGVVKFYPDDEEKSYSLTKESLIYGLKHWINNNPSGFELYNKDDYNNIDAGDIDADDADAILQYALFGEVVYG